MYAGTQMPSYSGAPFSTIAKKILPRRFQNSILDVLTQELTQTLKDAFYKISKY